MTLQRTAQTLWTFVFQNSSYDWAERFCRVSHESFDLLHRAGDAGQQLDTTRCYCNIIFNANLHIADTQWSAELSRTKSRRRSKVNSMQIFNMSWICLSKIYIITEVFNFKFSFETFYDMCFRIYTYEELPMSEEIT